VSANWSFYSFCFARRVPEWTDFRVGREKRHCLLVQISDAFEDLKSGNDLTGISFSKKPKQGKKKCSQG